MSLEQFRGRRLLLIFFNPDCGFCRQMAPDLAALPADPHDGRPVPLVVTTGDVEANRQFVREHGIRCPVALQEGMSVATGYQVTGTPMGYLIDEQGAIASDLAVGAQALLALATPAAMPAPSANGQNGHAVSENGNGHREYKGNRSLADSRINRNGLPAGTPAPDFRLPKLDGGDISLEAYRGRRVLLVFSDPACGPCNQLAPELERLHRRWPEIQVIMISRGDPEANRVKVAEHGLTFPVALQRQWEISREYGMFATPIGYLIDEEGIIAADVAVGVEAILSVLSTAAARSHGKEEVPMH
jgi:peroxiredoxin